MTRGVVFLIVLAIGIVAGLLYDRFLGPNWFSRQFSGSTRAMATSALVGVAGSFVGYHLGMLTLGPRDAVALVAAAAGSVLVLWGWRMIR